MTPKTHILMHGYDVPRNDRPAIIVRLIRVKSRVRATVESRILQAGVWETRPMLDERTITKQAALRLALDLAVIANIPDVYVVTEKDADR